MNIIVPYKNVHPVTRQVLTPLGAEFFYMHNDLSYCDLLRQFWSWGSTIRIVEQDIVPWPGALDELLMCSGMWCTYSYEMHGGIGISHMLGCCKLTEELMKALPDVWATPRHWSELDQHLFFAARENGIEPHLHRPPVTHLKG